MAESTIVMSKQANKLDGSLKAKAFTFLSKPVSYTHLTLPTIYSV